MKRDPGVYRFRDLSFRAVGMANMVEVRVYQYPNGVFRFKGGPGKIDFYTQDLDAVGWPDLLPGAPMPAGC